MLTPRIMKLHRYIDHDWQMTPIDFQVTRVSRTTRDTLHEAAQIPVWPQRYTLAAFLTPGCPGNRNM
ncbi:hypothetical protein DPMN_013180 [Dreissena polymorpha]|uniref:Uncharacterized protein n=1 Tax=Dreissena polymorpha TaxID=45954 RepID=A0A9D4N4X4_DREPO|nr:hypothetical protein DPMN_013180 [Dreissena polymorpha]